MKPPTYSLIIIPTLGALAFYAYLALQIQDANIRVDRLELELTLQKTQAETTHKKLKDELKDCWAFSE